MRNECEECGVVSEGFCHCYLQDTSTINTPHVQAHRPWVCGICRSLGVCVICHSFGIDKKIALWRMCCYRHKGKAMSTLLYFSLQQYVDFQSTLICSPAGRVDAGLAPVTPRPAL